MHQYTAFEARRRRGSVLVLAAACLIILFAFCAFTVDVGYIASTKTQLQNAADAAALAAAQNLSAGPAAAISAAQNVGAANMAAGHSVSISSGDVVLGTWDSMTLTFVPLSGAAQATANAAQVTCGCTQQKGNPLQMFFAPIIGVSVTDVSVSSIALAKSSRCGLIIGMQWVVMSGSAYTDSYNSKSGGYSPGQLGHVCSNGLITMSGTATIHGDAHPGPGLTVVRSGGASVTGSTTPLTTPLVNAPADPTQAALHNNNNNIPISALGKNPVDSHGNFALSGSDSITLPPGTYYFNKLDLSGSSKINVAGPVVIYAVGDVAFSGGTVENLTQVPSNLVLYPSGSKCDISGSSDFYGIVYGPTSQVIRSGTASYFGMIVGLNVTMSASGGIHADTSIAPLSGTSSQATLVK